MAAALPFDMPYQVKPFVQNSDGLTSFVLPTGPFTNGVLPGMRMEGQLEQTAWRVEDVGQTTLELLAPLRSSLQSAGFSLIYECDDDDCGGFDFRYALSVIPEPEMHVNLGDFRFISAIRKDEGVSILVSRSADAGFVQISHLTAPGAAKALETLPALKEVLPISAPSQTIVATQSDISSALEGAGRAALDDLNFASGRSELNDGDYQSLFDLAEWLRANPDRRVALVGHTDAAGSLEANTSLSKKRAEAVAQRLVAAHKIPSSQIEATGVGYLSPRATNQTEDGRRQNRRVEVVVTSTP